MKGAIPSCVGTGASPRGLMLVHSWTRGGGSDSFAGGGGDVSPRGLMLVHSWTRGGGSDSFAGGGGDVSPLKKGETPLSPNPLPLDVLEINKG